MSEKQVKSFLLNENWKPIDGFEDYEVSDSGRVKHLTIVTVAGRNWSERILKGSFNKDGYVTVTLRKNNKGHTKTVHRLVANAFIENPLKLEEVNHKDGNKQNNAVENLEWCDHSANMLHSYATGLHKPICGEKIKWSKLTWEDVDYIRANCIPNDPNMGINAMARKFNVQKNTINKIYHGATWKVKVKEA